MHAETAPQDPILLAPAPYLPFLEPRIAHPPGLMPLGIEDWVITHGDFAAQMAYREHLLAACPEVVLAAEPAAAAPARETLALLAEHLRHRHGYGAEPGALRRPDGVRVPLDAEVPFRTMARLVADDICLMLPDPASGEYRLAGAALLFPARWSLREKLTRPLTAIHDPVPDYDDTLARRVNRVFEAIRVDRPLWRINWLVHPTHELHQPVESAEKAAPLPEPTALGPLYLRTERQTLRRLPGSGAVVFGIKTSVTPIEALEPAVAGGLSRAIARLDPDTVAYRMGAFAYDTIIARLDALALQAAPGGATNARH